MDRLNSARIRSGAHHVKVDLSLNGAPFRESSNRSRPGDGYEFRPEVRKSVRHRRRCSGGPNFGRVHWIIDLGSRAHRLRAKL